MKHKIFLIIIFLLLLSNSFSHIIIFNHGSKLKIKSYYQKGEYLHLILSENSEMSIPSIWVKEIIFQKEENEAVPKEDNSLLQENFLDIIKKYSEEASLDWQLIYALIKIESNFNPKAVSPKGAQGLMQLMPETASQYNITNPFDPIENVKGGIKHFKNLLSLYNNNLSLALAAYNAGKENVDNYNGIPPFSETQGYVKKILGVYNSLKSNR